jgi:hypothetical protein
MREQKSATLTLRRWLAERTDSERITLARFWALPPRETWGASEVTDLFLQPESVARALAALGQRERAALEQVQAYGGAIPANILEREFGAVRRRERYPNQRAYLLALEQAPTATERLCAIGLVFEETHRRQRQYVIPPDLLELLPPVTLRDRTLRLTPVADPPQAYPGDAGEFERNLLTLIGLAQDGQLEVIPSGGLNKASLLRLARQWNAKARLQGVTREEHWPYIHFLRRIGESAGLLRAGSDSVLRPTREALEWMRQPAIERTRRLLQGWITTDWDELIHFVGLKLQRAYSRDLPSTRSAILELVAQAAAGQWVALKDFSEAVRQVDPDFARPDGDYTSWGILNRFRQPVDGFEYWDEIEGEQLRSIVGGSLHWLGLTDQGADDDNPISFRMNSLGAALLSGAPAPSEPLIEPLAVQPNFEVVVPVFASPYARFQIRRIAEQTGTDDVAIYKLTKRSIQSSLERGISIDDLQTFLQETSGRALPQNVAATLREWAGQHGQVVMRSGVVLEATDRALLEQIKRDKRIKLPEVEPLNATSWLVRNGDASTLAERLRKAGYGLSGDPGAPQTPLREHDMTVLFAALDFYDRACAALGVESDASGALRQRIGKLLPEKQLNRAYQTSHEALRALKERLDKHNLKG